MREGPRVQVLQVWNALLSCELRARWLAAAWCLRNRMHSECCVDGAAAGSVDDRTPAKKTRLLVTHKRAACRSALCSASGSRSRNPVRRT
eukprot:5165640-Prymnesium_polylepis.1